MTSNDDKQQLTYRELMAARSSRGSKDGYMNDAGKYENRLIKYDVHVLIGSMKSSMANNAYRDAAFILYQYHESRKQQTIASADDDEHYSMIAKQIFAYMKKVNSVRVNILGAAAAGKSTIIAMIKRWIQNRVDGMIGAPLISNDERNTNTATDGIHVSYININASTNNEDEEEKYAFWDFGGQEVLYCTHQFFLSEEAQYILVVDYSKLISTNKAVRKQCIDDCKYWISQIKLWTITHYSAPVIMIGTHCDLIQSRNPFNRNQ